MAQQERNFALHCAEQAANATHLIRDLDNKFGAAFDAVMESEGVSVVKVGPRKPNLNAVAERWIQSAKTECLDHFIVFGEEHPRQVVTAYVAFHSELRPHQWNDNRPLAGTDPTEWTGTLTLDAVACEERLGGLLKHYSRKAA